MDKSNHSLQDDKNCKCNSCEYSDKPSQLSDANICVGGVYYRNGKLIDVCRKIGSRVVKKLPGRLCTVSPNPLISKDLAKNITKKIADALKQIESTDLRKGGGVNEAGFKLGIIFALQSIKDIEGYKILSEYPLSKKPVPLREPASDSSKYVLNTEKVRDSKLGTLRGRIFPDLVLESPNGIIVIELKYIGAHAIRDIIGVGSGQQDRIKLSLRKEELVKKKVSDILKMRLTYGSDTMRSILEDAYKIQLVKYLKSMSVKIPFKPVTGMVIMGVGPRVFVRYPNCALLNYKFK